MKRLSILTLLAVLVSATACTVKEQDEVLMVPPQREEFYATIEQPSEVDTKTYADAQFRVLWHADDRITIFNRYTYNQEYAFQGETGDNAGGFSKVGGDEFVTGNDLSDIYSVYPYQKGTKISNDGVITVTLPTEQTWAEGSFGPGSNTMVSVTSDNKLRFRNVGGILAFKLYGNNVQVLKITLQGNNDELISGKASVTMPVGGTPSVAMQGDATQSITLTCDPPVTIGTTSESYTEFWFVVPPTDFSGGFTVTVTCADGKIFGKKTDKTISIERNHIARMAPLEVIPVKSAAVPEYVDLGLPSGVKWATFNIGASKPEEYGDYFSWGETNPYHEGGWEYDNEFGDKDKLYTEMWCSNRWCRYYPPKFIKYCPFDKTNYWAGSDSPDNKTVLDPEDDVASANWGGNWRMPTDTEWTELRDNCTWTWTDNYNGTGAAGRLVASDNGNSIFLPAAGGSQMYLSGVGDGGSYWSSSLDTDDPYRAWHVFFSSGYIYRGSGDRYNWRSVRPVYADRIQPESVSLNTTTLSLYVFSSAQLTATVFPDNARYKNVVWSSDNADVATVNPEGVVTAFKEGTTTIIATTVDGGKTAECVVTVSQMPISEAIDLGLPSGLKWAAFNIGASTPEEYGVYFAWGETKPKEDYSLATYKWCNGDRTRYTKYCTNYSYWDSSSPMDNKTVLDPEDDAVIANWGGIWRMPTDADWTELIENCTWTWTSDYKGTGIAGRVVTSKMTGYETKSIFLPAAGDRGGTYLSSVGSRGQYWSSSLSLFTDYQGNACCAYFHSNGVPMGGSGRCNGLSVRPVYGEFVPASSISLNKTSIVELNSGEKEQLTATISPLNATAKDVHWATSDESVAKVDNNGLISAVSPGRATITAYGSSGVSAECMVTVKARQPDSVEAVDLGLPSGLKWASCNVGATTPEEYGEYYAWGEIQPRTNDSWWSTYKWCNGEYNKLTKYCTQSSYWDSSAPMDNKTVLDLEDDAARANWGGIWRMPTDADWTELIENCIWTWTSDYNGTGIAGRVGTSKMSGYEDKSIFLPAAGYRRGTRLRDVGSNGYYWSSSLETVGPNYAWYVSFDSIDVYMIYYYRCDGQPVRPVTE